MHKQSEETGRSTYELSYELFLYAHKKEDGTYATPKDERIDARIHQIAAEEERSDLNEIYLEVVHPCKSRRYGNGSEGESQLSRSSRISGGSWSGGLSQELLRTQLSTLEERLEKAEAERAAERAALEVERAAERAKREALEQRLAMFEDFVRSGQFPPRSPPQHERECEIKKLGEEFSRKLQESG